MGAHSIHSFGSLEQALGLIMNTSTKSNWVTVSNGADKCFFMKNGVLAHLKSIETEIVGVMVVRA